MLPSPSETPASLNLGSYDAVQIAREVDVQRLRALLPEGYIVHTDDGTLRPSSRSWASKQSVPQSQRDGASGGKGGSQSVGRRGNLAETGDAQERGATTSCAQAEADATFAALKQHRRRRRQSAWRRGQSPRSAGEWSKVLVCRAMDCEGSRLTSMSLESL